MTAILDCFKNCPIDPVGYRMVLGQLPPKKESAGGIIIPDGSDTRRAQEILSSISQVVKQGPLCYEADHFHTFSEKKAFNDGLLIARGYNPVPRRWCNVGDWVLHGPNAGFRIPCQDGDVSPIYRILNDDEFLAIAPSLEELVKQMPLLTYNLTT